MSVMVGPRVSRSARADRVHPDRIAVLAGNGETVRLQGAKRAAAGLLGKPLGGAPPGTRRVEGLAGGETRMTVYCARKSVANCVTAGEPRML